MMKTEWEIVFALDVGLTIGAALVADYGLTRRPDQRFRLLSTAAVSGIESYARIKKDLTEMLSRLGVPLTDIVLELPMLDQKTTVVHEVKQVVQWCRLFIAEAEMSATSRDIRPTQWKSTPAKGWTPKIPWNVTIHEKDAARLGYWWLRWGRDLQPK